MSLSRQEFQCKLEACSWRLFPLCQRNRLNRDIILMIYEYDVFICLFLITWIFINKGVFKYQWLFNVIVELWFKLARNVLTNIFLKYRQTQYLYDTKDGASPNRFFSNIWCPMETERDTGGENNSFSWIVLFWPWLLRLMLTSRIFACF